MTRLIDSHSREINYLRISVTDRCNLRCVYCMPEEGIPLAHPKDVLTYEEIVRITTIAAGLGVNKVRITGGEPLVRKSVDELVRAIVDVEGISEVGLTTNGLLLDQYAGKLKEAGLTRVNVSLDTLKPERFLKIARKPGLDKAFSGIEAAHKAGLKIKVNVVPLVGMNEDEIPEFARLTMARPYEVRFIEHMPSEGFDNAQSKGLTNDEVLEALKNFFEIEMIDASSGQVTGRVLKIKGAQGTIGLISPMSKSFCGGCNRIRVTSSGHIITCIMGGSASVNGDLRLALRRDDGDEKLADIIRRAVADKPLGPDEFERTGIKKCARPMRTVGG